MPKCCNKVCSSYACPQDYEPVDDADTTVCKDSSCSTDQCCKKDEFRFEHAQCKVVIHMIDRRRLWALLRLQTTFSDTEINPIRVQEDCYRPDILICFIFVYSYIFLVFFRWTISKCWNAPQTRCTATPTAVPMGTLWSMRPTKRNVRMASARRLCAATKSAPASAALRTTNRWTTRTPRCAKTPVAVLQEGRVDFWTRPMQGRGLYGVS